MDNLSVEPLKIKAFVIEDKDEGLFTVSLEGKGGPIVSAHTFEEACEKFNKALSLLYALNIFDRYKDAINSNEEEMSQFVKKLKPHKPQVDFVSMPAFL